MRNRRGNGDGKWPGAQRLQKLCKAVDITGPTQLAAAIARHEGRDVPLDKLSVSGASGWWNGTRRPTVDNLESIIAVTGGNIEYLVLGRGDMFVTDPSAKAVAFDQIAAIVERVTRSATDRRHDGGRAIAKLQKALPKPRKHRPAGEEDPPAQGVRRARKRG